MGIHTAVKNNFILFAYVLMKRYLFLILINLWFLCLREWKISDRLRKQSTIIFFNTMRLAIKGVPINSFIPGVPWRTAEVELSYALFISMIWINFEYDSISTYPTRCNIFPPIYYSWMYFLLNSGSDADLQSTKVEVPSRLVCISTK